MILSNDNKYKGDIAKSLKLDEKRHVEDPFLEQLKQQGWETLVLDNHHEPYHSKRKSFSEVFIEEDLRIALKNINPFLTESQITEVIQKLPVTLDGKLIENNKKVWEFLLKGTTVSRNELTGEDSPTVRFIDLYDETKNSYLAISQFKLRIPGTENHIIPDIVLFINGLPLVVVECKSPKVKDSIGEAIDQLMRYSQQRNEAMEGNQILFYYNQFTVVTDRQIAKFGTISTHSEKYFFRWTDPYPKTLDEIQSREGTSPNDQQRLIAGMLTKRNLIELIRSFTIFTTDDKGNTIKIVARYQQYRAVKKSIRSLIDGRNARERGGIIWHTQGSGKSLTMMFMVREMRKHKKLLPWKVVFITDRTQLEEQLSETSDSIGYTVKRADSIRKLKELLSSPAPDLVMGMIHKFQERELENIFPELNPSSNILVMTDEAHRTQYSLLGANLRRALPNATHIAYTGTPIDLTEQHFGEYIDKYTMRQSIDDGTTLKIVYEGRTHNAEVPNPKVMDIKFQDVFSDYNLAQRMKILGYGSRDAYLEAMPTIKSKAEDMLEHYVNFVFPNRLKAQIVAVSREAAIRYKEAIEELLPKFIEKLEKHNPHNINIELLKKLETAVIISHSHNDKPRFNPYTNSDIHKTQIRRFKLPFEIVENDLDGNIGIIIVNEMLITGFDAPVEQVMYLDRYVRDHNLLQAIARVNRIGPEGKDVGYVVDYIVIGHHIKQALDSYAEREQKEIIDGLSNNEEEINELIQLHTQIWDFLKKYNCTDFNDPDAFFDLFYDEDIRFEYLNLFKKLSAAFNRVLPHPKALDYLMDYQRFVEVNLLCSKHFQDSRLSMRGIPEKLRSITDEYLSSKGINQKVKPISILDSEFYENVKARKRVKTKAAEIEHALRHYIYVSAEDDPELFKTFSEMLEEIFEKFKGDWNKIYEELEKLREKIRDKEKEETYGLNRTTQMPFFRIFKRELYNDKELSEDEISSAVDLTQNLYVLLNNELKTVGFWDSIPSQNKLKAEIQKLLLNERFVQLPNMFEKYKEITTRILEVARYKNDSIVNDNRL